MAFDPVFRAEVMERLAGVAPVWDRAMFGAVGIYCDDLFFAIVAGTALYFKVDDSNRADYEQAGMAAFRPFGDDSGPLGYYEVPRAVLENREELSVWVNKALHVAETKGRRRRERRSGPRPRRGRTL